MSSPRVDDKSKPIKLKDFLEKVPPDKRRVIDGLLYITSQTNRSVIAGRESFNQGLPTIELHCPSASCGDKRLFTPNYSEIVSRLIFAEYKCRNCSTIIKIFALLFFIEGTIERLSNDDVSERLGVSGPASLSQSNRVSAVKLGEYPEFALPLPAKLISLIGPDRDLFLQGWRSEKRGFGIGAFAYYRRVVENQKNRLIDEIIKVAKELRAPDDEIKKFGDSARLTQFSRSVDEIKGVLPERILIDGHNPMTLLHAALSDRLHNQTDLECLELAQTIREVLTELAETMDDVLKDRKHLRAQISRLMAPDKTE